LRQFVSSMSFLPFLPTVFCPVSPSLWWVPWALVPHSLDPSNTRVLSYFVVTLYKVIGTMLHYDCHQPISRRFAFWLADVIPDQLPRFVSRPRRLARRRKQPAGNKALGHPVPFIFRASFIRKLMALPSSRVTPLTTCPALETPVVSCVLACELDARRTQDCCLPLHAKRRLWLPPYQRVVIPMSTTIHISRLNDAACHLASPSSAPPIAGLASRGHY